MTTIQKRCYEFVKVTQFKNNCIYDENETLETAYTKAVAGKDNGVEGMNKLMPTSTDMEKWLDYFFFCYLLYRHCK